MLISLPFPDKEPMEHDGQTSFSTAIHQSKNNVGLETAIFSDGLHVEHYYFLLQFKKIKN